MDNVTTITPGETAIKVRLQLDSIEQLFQAPELDPFVDQPRLTSGVDDIAAYLATQRLRHVPKLKTTLILPHDQITPGLLDETRAAVGRYCEFMLSQIRNQMDARRFEGRNKLPLGLAVAVITFLVTLIIYVLLPDTASSLLIFLSPVVTVIIWVSIWNPMEILLFSRWTNRREMQITTAIQDMEIAIESSPAVTE